MIIRGGENVYPREIEEFLYTHPKIADCAVFGVPCEKYGEQVVAWVKLKGELEPPVTKSSGLLSESDIKQFCKTQIAHYKIPSSIFIVEQFPLTVTGKIQKFIMREETIKFRNGGDGKEWKLRLNDVKN
jgi:fatty-acyl-CoA synthase